MTLEHLDIALKFFYEATEWVRDFHLEKHFEEKFPGNNDIDTPIVIQKLLKDEYIYSEFYTNELSRSFGDQGKHYYSISFDGIQFYNKGGYEKHEERQLAERVFRKKKRALELKQIRSVIKTNEAVNNNIKTQERLTTVSLIIAAASTLFILGTILLQFFDKTPQRLEDIKTELQTTRKTLDSIALSHKSIDSSMKAFEHSQNKSTAIPSPDSTKN